MRRISSEKLHALAMALGRATGSEEAEARIVADHLIRANLTGHDSHGVGMYSRYIESLSLGRLQPNTACRVVADNGATMVFDGGYGYGQRVAREATDQAIARARDIGAVISAFRHGHHIGRIGSYGEQAAAAGMGFIGFVNVVDHDPSVAPWGGSEARYITNPICIALPATDANPMVLLDFATSQIALGKVRVAHNKRVPTPEGALIAADGTPTTDPGVMFPPPFRGALTPFGGHKGSGLALVAELLAGAIGGGGTNHPGHTRVGGVVNNMLSVVFDPTRLTETSLIAAETDAMIAYAKSARRVNPDAPILTAGDPERASEAERLKNGVPIDDNTVRELIAGGVSLGCAAAELEALIAQ